MALNEVSRDVDSLFLEVVFGRYQLSVDVGSHLVISLKREIVMTGVVEADSAI